MEIYLLNKGKYLKEALINQIAVENIDYTIIQEYRELSEGDLLIGVYDYFDYEYEKELTRFCFENKVILIRANLLFDQAFIGPTFNGENSCINCFIKMLSNNVPDSPMLLMKNVNYMESHRKTNYDHIWNAYYIDYIVKNLIDEIKSIKNNSKLIFENTIRVVKENSFNILTHHIEPEEYCEICGHLPEDSPELARFSIEDEKKVSATNYRINPAPTNEELRNIVVDKDTGKIKHVFKEFISRFIPFSGSEVFCKEKIDMGYGRSADYRSAELCGMLEAMERYSGMYNKKSISKIYGSYNELKDKAINPRKLGLHSKEQLKQKGFDFIEYTDDLKYYWVWGWSLKENKAVLIPEQMAYYAPNPVRKNFERFVFETSNGCALGSTLNEAFLYGLFEVIERDNFLVSWYNKLSLKEIDIEGSKIKEISRLKIYIESLGYELHFYDMSMELKVPSIWGVIINRKNNAVVKTYSAAGANFNPESALRGALIEIGTSISIYEKTYLDENLQKRREKMYKDSNEVTEFEDHVLLYSHSKAEERLKFLINNSTEKDTLQNIYPEWYEGKSYHNKNLKDDINELLDKIFKYYEDIYVVNLTGDLLKKMDLRSVKVLVPGMLTMSFGHQYRRIIDERILNGPVLAGRRDKPINIQDYNRLPHPFP